MAVEIISHGMAWHGMAGQRRAGQGSAGRTYEWSPPAEYHHLAEPQQTAGTIPQETQREIKKKK